MKQVSRIGTATMCVVIVFAASGCPRSNPPSGFKVTATEVVSIPGVAPFNIPLAGIPVTGSWDNDLPGTVTGNRRSFGDYTNFNGWFVVSDGRIPARWTSGVVDPNTPPVCSANVADFNVTREHPSIDWFCPHIVTSAAPAFSIVSALPPTLSINASGYSTAYGMPHLNLYG